MEIGFPVVNRSRVARSLACSVSESPVKLFLLAHSRGCSATIPTRGTAVLQRTAQLVPYQTAYSSSCGGCILVAVFCDFSFFPCLLLHLLLHLCSCGVVVELQSENGEWILETTTSESAARVRTKQLTVAVGTAYSSCGDSLQL